VSFLAEVEQIVLDLLHREVIGTAAVIADQAGDCLQIGFLGILGQITYPQVVRDLEKINLQDYGKIKNIY